MLDSFPRLFAACHVLHRLLTPRHPPWTLSSLDIKESKTLVLAMQFSRYLFADQGRQIGVWRMPNSPSLVSLPAMKAGVSARKLLFDGPQGHQTPSQLNSVPDSRVTSPGSYLLLRETSRESNNQYINLRACVAKQHIGVSYGNSVQCLHCHLLCYYTSSPS